MTNKVKINHVEILKKQLLETDEIDLEIVKLRGKLKQVKDKLTIFVVLGAIIAIVGSLYATFSPIFLNQTYVSGSKQFLMVLLSITYGLVIIMFTLFFSRIIRNRIESDIEYLIAKKKLASEFRKSKTLKSTQQETYFDKLVEINVENLSQYYKLVLVHTSNSFNLSSLCGIVGFILISLGLIIGFVNDSNSNVITYLSIGSGIIIEFISGIFFYLYNKTVSQLKDYHDSLIDVQNILLSFKIIEGVKDNRIRSKIVGDLVLSLIGRIK